MTDEAPSTITIEAIVEKAEDSVACGIVIASGDVLQWFGRKTRIPVVATINGYVWRTSLAPMGGSHVLPVNADAREGAGVYAGDAVTLSVQEDLAERNIDVPDDLAAALFAAGVRTRFDAMAFTHRKEWIRAVLDAKREETRLKRIRSCIEQMKAR
jgi:Domain of unknown function (DUF1905)/Bacteriocin-protection, YdeI or OmpD-Associated